MTDLRCQDCGVESTYADAEISDALNTCTNDHEKSVDSLEVVRHTPLGGRMNGKSHNWIEK
jgi:hypothetical protein